ncbi:hypothetical protein ACFLT1_02680 [Bacteroidota bacterium]
MNVNELRNFLQKASLNGLVKESRWKVKDKTLYIKFQNEEEKLNGGVKIIDFNLRDIEFGVIRNTGEVIKSLKTLYNKDLKFDIEGEYLNISDGDMTVGITIADSSLITYYSPKRNIEYVSEIELSESFISKFLHCSSINSKLFNINIDGEIAHFVIGDNLEMNHSMTFKYPCTESKNFSLKYYSVKNFKSILNKNREYLKGSIKLNSAGLLNVQFSNEYYFSSYYLLPEYSH